MCHIHVGYDDPDDDISLELIKAMDLFLGVPSILIDPDTDRRKLYGKAGCFRFTPYGCEYRVLSGLFIKTKALIEWCFNQTVRAIDFVNSGNTASKDKVAIFDAINKNDENAALSLIKKYNIKF